MNTTLPWSSKLPTPASLRLSHDDARAGFVQATMQGGETAVAARQLARMCLPHFELEETFAFPTLGLLPNLMKGLDRSEMLQILPLISDFSAKHSALDKQHESIQSAIDTLLRISYKEGNKDTAEFAYNMRVHERIEDEVIYPTVMLIGAYLREKLAIQA